MYILLPSLLIDPNNPPGKRGTHSKDLGGDQIDHFSYFGAPVQSGQTWRAKCKIHSPSFPFVLLKLSSLTSFTSNQIAILTSSYPNQQVLQETVNKYSGETDPALLFKLPNEIRSGATLFGFQKVYEGIWSFDIFFDSKSMPGGVRMDC